MRDDSELESWLREQVQYSNAVDEDVVAMYRTLTEYVWLAEHESASSEVFARRVVSVCRREVTDVPAAVEDATVVAFERGDFEGVEDALVVFLDCYTDYHFGPAGVTVPTWAKRLIELVSIVVEALALTEIVFRMLGLR
jgi:uncharacterized protein YfaT (DUF1175 family)